MTGKMPKRKDRPGVDRYGRTRLHYAALEGDTTTLSTLLRDGLNPSAQDDNGLTPLHFAAQARHVEVARMLLAQGADANLTDCHGNGPLWTAIMNAKGDTVVAELLVQAGADPDRKNLHGRSPLDMARTIGHGLEKPFERGPKGAA